MEAVKDQTLYQNVANTLASRGICAPCRVNVFVDHGNVTLSGSIQYEHQRQTVLLATRSIQGVVRVFDQMHVLPRGQTR